MYFRLNLNDPLILKCRKFLNDDLEDGKGGNITLNDKQKCSVGMYRVIEGDCLPDFNDIVQRVAEISCS